MKALVRLLLAVGILAAWSRGDFVLVWILVFIELSMMKTFLLALVLLALGGAVFVGLLKPNANLTDFAVAVGLAVVAIYLHAARHRGWLLLRLWREV